MPSPNASLDTVIAKGSPPAGAQSPVQGPVTVDQNLILASNNEQNEYVEDGFWLRPETDITKWDRLCPYQLLVVGTRTSEGQGTQKVSYAPYKDWQYTLPLPPESIHVSTPFSIQVTPTLDGIVEEHNGAVFRHITFRGTTGFLPARATGASRAGTGALGMLEDQVTSIFAGTVGTIRSAKGSVLKAIDSAVNAAPQAYNFHQEAEFTVTSPDNILANTSGFKQIALLRDFLESYVALKKQNTNLAKTLRLAVAVWKENQIFLVTPISFDVSKSANSPLEYVYSLTFRAWKRIDLEAGNFEDVSPVPIRHNPNLIARAINTLTNARKAIQMIGTLKQAVLGDVDYIFKPFHDTILLGKDLLGASLSLSDIPSSVKQRVKISVLNLKYESGQIWNQLSSSQTNKDSVRAIHRAVSANLRDLPVNGSSNASIQSAANARSQVAIKDIPDDLADQIPVSSLSLPQDIKSDILKDISRVRNLRRKDFEDYANTVRSTADKIAFLVGAGDPTYGETYGINIASIKTEPTQADWDSLNALNDSVTVLQQFAATADGEPAQGQTYLESFGGLAVASGIAWTQPVSKFAVPFPYGGTLEGLANTYLGDPNRFNEIVALNGLRAPYVDEAGYVLPLTVNGKGKTVVVNYSSDLFVGKTVWLSSTTANRTQYVIESLQTVGLVSTIKLNDFVDTYRVADQAVLEAFLSGTICSRNLIWIPSDVQPLDPESVVTKDILGVNVTDPMVSIGGVDLQLGPDLDLVLVDNELRYSVGLSNIVQWVRGVLSIEKGELLQHQDLGMPLSIGLSLADFNAQDVVQAIRKQLSQDSMFSRIDKITVTQNGPAVSIQISALVAGTSQPLPLNYGMQLSA